MKMMQIKWTKVSITLQQLRSEVSKQNLITTADIM